MSDWRSGRGELLAIGCADDAARRGSDRPPTFRATIRAPFPHPDIRPFRLAPLSPIGH